MVDGVRVAMGEVEVSLHYIPGCLVVDLHRGKEICGKRSQDSYAQVFLIEDNGNALWDQHQKAFFEKVNETVHERTRLFKKNLNPEFDDKFTFKMDHAALLRKSLVIAIWDMDSASKDDYMAGVTFPLRDVARFDCLGKKVDITLQVQEKDGYVSVL